jgi:hypothetical protein
MGPRGQGVGLHQVQRESVGQRALRATRRQLNRDARDMFDHARGDLGQALAVGRELGADERVCWRNRARPPCIS